MSHKYKRGDRIVSVGHTVNCREQGRIGTIKRIATGFSSGEFYVVEWDDGGGWRDRIEPGKGWSIAESELIILNEYDDIGYEMDA